MGVANDGPPAKISVIERVYPDLHKRVVTLDKRPVSWNRLRKMATVRWHKQHPGSLESLAFLYNRHGDYWKSVEATWDALGFPEYKRPFYRCIPRYEGGFSHPDVRYGGATGYSGLSFAGNVVLGPWQVRPGWVNGARSGRWGTYGYDRWNYDAYIWAINPVNMARLVTYISPSNFATAHLCS